MSEDILDSNTRNAILAKVAGLGKREPQPIQESRTPGVNVTTSDLTSTAPKKWAESTPITETTSTQKVNELADDRAICKNCGHKLWDGGGEWFHVGKFHNENCECREPVPDSGTVVSRGPSLVRSAPMRATESTTKKFDSTTPFDQLLEACADSHTAAVEADTVASDEVRNRVIKECNTDPSFLKDWRF